MPFVCFTCTIFHPFLSPDFDETMGLWRCGLTPSASLYYFLKPVPCNSAIRQSRLRGTYKGISSCTSDEQQRKDTDQIDCLMCTHPFKFSRRDFDSLNLFSRPRIVSAPAIPFYAMGFWTFNAAGVLPFFRSKFGLFNMALRPSSLSLFSHLILGVCVFANPFFAWTFVTYSNDLQRE